MRFLRECILFCSAFVCLLVLMNACRQNRGKAPYVLSIPKGFPQPFIPEDNPLTQGKVALGKKLFFEPILSRDSSISCASCHFPELAFSDTAAVSTGVAGRKGFRNAPSLTNVAYGKSFFKDGGVPTLEIQILTPLEGHDEMDLNILEAAERLNKNPAYKKLFQEVFDRVPDAFGITRAIAAFERTLISGHSRFDRYYYHGEEVLSASEKRGWLLFNSETLQCATCHAGFNFTNEQFENNGLYEVYADEGRRRITLDSADAGKFKVPTLRNSAVTGPYMHDGSFSSLEEVIEHYSRGGKGHGNQSELIKGFSLTEVEKQDLLAFLKALTDATFLANTDFRPHVP